MLELLRGPSEFVKHGLFCAGQGWVVMEGAARRPYRRRSLDRRIGWRQEVGGGGGDGKRGWLYGWRGASESRRCPLTVLWPGLACDGERGFAGGGSVRFGDRLSGKLALSYL